MLSWEGGGGYRNRYLPSCTTVFSSICVLSPSVLLVLSTLSPLFGVDALQDTWFIQARLCKISRTFQGLLKSYTTVFKDYKFMKHTESDIKI